MDDKQNNVLRFPNKKSESNSASDSAPVNVSSRISPKRSPIQLAMGMALVLALNWWANRQTPSASTLEIASVSGGRAIASVQERIVQAEDRDAQWEKSLARGLKVLPRRDLASLRLGQRPSVEDDLRFGFLKLQYAMTMKGGKVAEIHWPENETEQAVYLGDGTRFLNKFREAFSVDYVAAVREGQRSSGSMTTEVYSLLDATRAKVGEAHFGLDSFGHLLSLSFASPNSDL